MFSLSCFLQYRTEVVWIFFCSHCMQGKQRFLIFHHEYFSFCLDNSLSVSLVIFKLKLIGVMTHKQDYNNIIPFPKCKHSH